MCISYVFYHLVGNVLPTGLISEINGNLFPKTKVRALKNEVRLLRELAMDSYKPAEFY
jgi:hypothetical protein